MVNDSLQTCKDYFCSDRTLNYPTEKNKSDSTAHVESMRPLAELVQLAEGGDQMQVLAQDMLSVDPLLRKPARILLENEIFCGWRCGKSNENEGRNS